MAAEPEPLVPLVVPPAPVGTAAPVDAPAGLELPVVRLSELPVVRLSELSVVGLSEPSVPLSVPARVPSVPVPGASPVGSAVSTRV